MRQGGGVPWRALTLSSGFVAAIAAATWLLASALQGATPNWVAVLAMVPVALLTVGAHRLRIIALLRGSRSREEELMGRWIAAGQELRQALNLLEDERRRGDQLSRLCQLHEEHIESLEGQLHDAKAAARSATFVGIAEEIRGMREELDGTRTSFLAFLHDFYFPVAERYEAFVRQADECQQRLEFVLDALDATATTLDLGGSEPTLKVVLPRDPVEAFVGASGASDLASVNRARKKLASIFHPDKAGHLQLRWVTELFEAVFKYLERQRDALEAKRRAG